MNAMMTEQVIVTNEMIEAGKSGMGGWNRRQVEAIGMKWPLTQGWKFRIIGTTVERSKVAAFLSLKGATKRPRKIRGQTANDGYRYLGIRSGMVRRNRPIKPDC